ncbi:MAG: hypothetical protein KDE03_16370 [Rhodobacteraceae bacterium]|nr:hypothetical protein [Paracoccaceae bacterium]
MFQTACLVPWFDGAIHSTEWKEALSDVLQRQETPFIAGRPDARSGISQTVGTNPGGGITERKIHLQNCPKLFKQSELPLSNTSCPAASRVLVPTRPEFERRLKRAGITLPIFALAEPGVGRWPEPEGFVPTQDDLAAAPCDILRGPCYMSVLA